MSHMQTLKPARGKNLVDFAKYGWPGGINIQDPPQEIADSDLTSAINVYLDEGGAISGRLGMQANGPVIVRSGMGTGMYRFFQNVSGGSPTTFKATLMQVGGNLYNADTGQNYGSIGGFGAGSMSCAKVFDPDWNGGTDLLIICTGSGGPYMFAGTGPFGGLRPYATTGTTVTGARWCYALNGILWFGGLPVQPNTLAGSIAGQPSQLPGYAIFSFSSPVSGLSSLGLGLQSTLVCGLDYGVGLISGFTPNSYIEQEIIPSYNQGARDGCVAGLAMCNVGGYTFIPGRYAFYRYDGMNFNEVSRKIRPWVLCDPTHPEFPMNGDRSLTWAMQWDQRLYFWFASNSAVPNVAFVLDITTNGWTVYNGVALGAAAAIDAPGDPTPTKLMVADAVLGQQHLFDTYNSTDPTSPWAVSDNGAVVSQSFMTKFYRIGVPGVLKRVIQSRSATLSQLATAANMCVTTNSLEAGINVNQTSVTSQLNSGLTTAAEPGFRNPRADWNIQGEAFAFGMTTPPGQATPVAPWRCTGITGRISQSPRS